MLDESADGIAIVEGGIVSTGSAIGFSGKGKSGGAGVKCGTEKSDATELGLFSGFEQLIEFGAGEWNGGSSDLREFIFVYKLIGKAGDADGVIRGLAANDEEFGVVGDGVLIIAAIAATAADAAALGKESDESDGVMGGVWTVERGDMIQERGFTVNSFGDGVFGVATEYDVVLPVFLNDGGGTNVEMRDGGIGAGRFSGIERAKDIGFEFGVGDERFGIGSKLPGSGCRGLVGTRRQQERCEGHQR